MRWGRTLLVVVIGSLAACTSGGTDQGQASVSGDGSAAAASGDGSVAAAQQGMHLRWPAAQALEKTLQAAPDNLNAREQLVGFYFIAPALGPSYPPATLDPNAPVIARDQQLLWLIQHSPGLELLGTAPMGVVQPMPDAAGYSAAKDAWSRQLTDQALPPVKGNAGIFLAQTDDPRAADLLTAAESADVKNATWPGALADLYAQQAKSSPLGSQAAQQAAASAVRELEKAWNLSGSSNRDPRLSQLAKLAVVAGQDAKATQYATVLLDTFKPGPSQSPLTVGGPIHDGNMVLGRVALHRGDRTGAELYLLKAGATPGSPLMDQYGPNFSLARDLLLVGSRDVVLKYCDEVANFWGDPRLQTWRAAIAAAQVPDFGDNLWV